MDDIFYDPRISRIEKNIGQFLSKIYRLIREYIRYLCVTNEQYGIVK